MRKALLVAVAIVAANAANAQTVSQSVANVLFPNRNLAGSGLSWKPNHADQHIMPRHGPFQSSSFAGRSKFTGPMFNGLSAAAARDQIGRLCNQAAASGTGRIGGSGFPEATASFNTDVGVSSRSSGAPATYTRRIVCEFRIDRQPPSGSGITPGGPQSWYVFTAYPSHF